jgi:predicted dithiol-disulfide oxidoreductase (DUF899 family)
MSRLEAATSTVYSPASTTQRCAPMFQYGRGTERLSHLNGLVDLLPYGRQEEWEDSPAGWPLYPTCSQGMGSKEIGARG